ncbi:transposase [Paraburkholderia sp. RL18-103-BIB-C]|uniref:transposase n=1 Tax=Paraburkholderia sp. RL18-103-BIB-C TaxID=3031637 RepID=UPI0038BB520D
MDLTQIHGLGPYLALKLVAECGTDTSRFPTVKHFTSWLCLAPGNKISGGRVLSSKTRRSSSKATASCRRHDRQDGHCTGRLLPTPIGTDRQGKGRHCHGSQGRGAVLQHVALRHGVR